MNASSRQELLVDDNVIYTTPEESNKNDMKRSESGNGAVGADIVMDKGLKVQGSHWKTETLGIPASVVNVMSSEEHGKVGNSESKTPSESDIEATEIPEAIISEINSPLFRTILRLGNKYGNDECLKDTQKFILGLKDIAEDDEPGVAEDDEPGVAECIEAQHGQDKNYWNLLRNAPLSEKNDNKLKVSALCKELLENDIFKKKTPQGSTMLHIAAENGDKHLVKKIVREANDLLTAKTLTGDTALHVAAKAGHFPVVKKLIIAHFKNSENNINGGDQALRNILETNNEGNTFFHEALINGHGGVMNFLLSHGDGNLKEVAKGAALSVTSNGKKSGLYLAIESGNEHILDQALIQVIPNEPDYVPEGKSLLLAAIIKKDQGILDTILSKRREWIHLRDTQGRLPLHYAASIGYLEGVQNLLSKCDSCVMETDKKGYLPIHLASYGGHITIVQELLKSEHCPDPKEILHKDGRNILHLAAQSGKLNVVKFILQASHSNQGLQNMINEQDCNGNTPLHLATLSCHPKIVHAFTWDKRVDLYSVNKKGQTALDAFQSYENPSLRERLTWEALKSGGVKSVEPKSMANKVLRENTYIFREQKVPDMEPFKDRINTLIVVSTLIITATFATGFTLPGGTDDKGTAQMLHHTWFKIFIFCITISMYGAISVTIILIWAQLGDITLALVAVKVASPLLGITLGTLSLAFLAGVHLVIAGLTWLDTSFMAMGLFFIFMLLLLYTMLWLPSTRNNLVVRYVSYYPFLMLASLVDSDED